MGERYSEASEVIGAVARRLLPVVDALEAGDFSAAEAAFNRAIAPE